MLSFLFQTSPQANPIMGFVPVLLIFAIFYFLLFLPMQRQKKQTKEMLDNLKAGDEVVTTGGLVGAVSEIRPDETLVLRLKPDNVRVLVAKNAVAGLTNPPAKS
jgi:preprotein translocase subunit YajC